MTHLSNIIFELLLDVMLSQQGNEQFDRNVQRNKSRGSDHRRPFHLYQHNILEEIRRILQGLKNYFPQLFSYSFCSRTHSLFLLLILS
jgi:hypothetical protein